MAFIDINDAIVDSVFWNGTAARIHEEFTRNDGETGKSYFTVWTKDGFPADEGDVVNVRGSVSVKTKSYEDKNTGETRWSSEVNVNNARVEVVGEAGGNDEYEAPF